jgi:hypothetical protein
MVPSAALVALLRAMATPVMTDASRRERRPWHSKSSSSAAPGRFRYFKQRLAASSPEPHELDRLYDRICAEQSSLGA